MLGAEPYCIMWRKRLWSCLISAITRCFNSIRWLVNWSTDLCCYINTLLWAWHLVGTCLEAYRQLMLWKRHWISKSPAQQPHTSPWETHGSVVLSFHLHFLSGLSLGHLALEAFEKCAFVKNWDTLKACLDAHCGVELRQYKTCLKGQTQATW